MVSQDSSARNVTGRQIENVVHNEPMLVKTKLWSSERHLLQLGLTTNDNKTGSTSLHVLRVCSYWFPNCLFINYWIIYLWLSNCTYYSI